MLFAGSDGDAEYWATIASLIETCKLNDVDPFAYLTDVLTRIANGHPNRDIDQLLPRACRKQEPENTAPERATSMVVRQPAYPRCSCFKSSRIDETVLL